jgi:tRNA A37 threonylcarbamoyladenosine dehydratase
MIEVKDIWKTYGDKLAKKIRYELKKSGFKDKFDVVFSSEEPKCEEMGSFMAVTGSFGLTICSLVVKRLIS